jgi:hypothetical protein
VSFLEFRTVAFEPKEIYRQLTDPHSTESVSQTFEVQKNPTTVKKEFLDVRQRFESVAFDPGSLRTREIKRPSLQGGANDSSNQINRKRSTSVTNQS